MTCRCSTPVLVLVAALLFACSDKTQAPESDTSPRPALHDDVAHHAERDDIGDVPEQHDDQEADIGQSSQDINSSGDGSTGDNRATADTGDGLKDDLGDDGSTDSEASAPDGASDTDQAGDAATHDILDSSLGENTEGAENETGESGVSDSLGAEDGQEDIDGLSLAEAEAAQDAPNETGDAEGEAEAVLTDAETTQGPCPCGWDETECYAMSAMLEVKTLDVWAQPLLVADLSLWKAGGGWATSTSEVTMVLPLCGAMNLSLEVTALHHHTLNAQLDYDGSGESGGLEVAVGATDTAATLSSEVREVEGQPTRVFTLWVGLAHRWFSPSGPAARHGNIVTLFTSGEEAWATVLTELEFASSEVTAATWWWTSAFELFRDAELHPYLTKADRWPLTMMGALQDLGWLWGVKSQVLIGQFYSQDGLLSSVTMDEPIMTAAESPGDGIEMMGMANEANGQFWVEMGESRFLDALGTSVLSSDATILASREVPPILEPTFVDMSELPVGVGLLDIPLASWHQKFLTVDQQIAFIGGMNIKTTDWDTDEHGVFEYRRMLIDATMEARLDVMSGASFPDFSPRKDYMVRLEGPSVADAVGVFNTRWEHQREAGVSYAELTTPHEAAAPPAPHIEGIQAQVVTTMPAPFSQHSIADTLLRAIGQAQTMIYIEDQYFRSPILADALVDRMLEVPELVLIVLTGSVDEWVDPGCWQTHLQAELFTTTFPERFRLYQAQSFAAVDTACVLCTDEVEGSFVAHSLHSKLVLIDDVYLEVGSCNHNNRGLLYEGEMALAIFDAAWVKAQRDQIMSNLLGAFYDVNVSGAALLERFDDAATWNTMVYEAWEAEGFDLNLNGAPLDELYWPEGFIYPLQFGAPTDCFFEDVGPDVTERRRGADTRAPEHNDGDKTTPSRTQGDKRKIRG